MEVTGFEVTGNVWSWALKLNSLPSNWTGRPSALSLSSYIICYLVPALFYPMFAHKGFMVFHGAGNPEPERYFFFFSQIPACGRAIAGEPCTSFCCQNYFDFNARTLQLEIAEPEDGLEVRTYGCTGAPDAINNFVHGLDTALGILSITSVLFTDIPSCLIIVFPILSLLRPLSI